MPEELSYAEPTTEIKQPGTVIGASDQLPVSSFASTTATYPLESLESPAPTPLQTPLVENPVPRTVQFSRRQAFIVALILTIVVTLITGAAALWIAKRTPVGQLSGNQSVPTQNINVTSTSSGQGASELQGPNQSLFVNGDIITRGSLKLSNGSFIGTLSLANLDANQNYKLPNASGALCLDSNNCNYATSSQLSAVRNQTGGGVRTLNGQSGSVTLQGAANQINVNSGGGTITLSTPQDIALGSSPTFNALTLSSLDCTGFVNGGALTTDANGNLSCSDDDGAAGGTVTSPGGTTNRLPVFSGAQTIADSWLLQNGSTLELDSGRNLSLLGGDLTVTGNQTTTGTTTLSALSNGFLEVNGAGVVSVGTIDLGTDTSGDYVASLTAGNGLTGSASGEGSTPTVAVGSANGGIVVNSDDIALTLQNSADGLSSTTSSGSGLEILSGGLSLLQGCNSGEVLKWNETTDVWECAADAGSSGVGDDIYVNGTTVSNANFIDSAASGTTAAITWNLNTVPSPDEVSLTVGAASATDAGVVTTGVQTLAGAKTFSSQITASGGLNLGAQTLQGTTAVIDFTNFDVSSGGQLTFTGVATDITTGTNEDLTVQANGTGLISLNDTVQIPTLDSAGSTAICRNASNNLATCNSTNPNSVTLQQAYDASTNPEIVINSSNGALTVRDASSPIGANLLEVQNNAGTTTYFSVDSSGLNSGLATANLLNSTVTTANILGAATNINVGSSSGFNWTPGGNVTIPLGNSKGLTVTSDLSGGARSTDVVTISQANNASNNSTGSLLSLTNSDTGSTASVLSIVQNASNGVGIDLSGNGQQDAINVRALTNGTGISLGGTNFNAGKFIDIASVSNALTSGNAINISGAATDVTAAFTGAYINVSPQRTLAASGSSIDNTGNFLVLNRANTVNAAGKTYITSGDLATFSSNCTQTAGTCTDTAHILTLNQQYANASGSVLNILNSGSGAGITIDGSTADITTGTNQDLSLQGNGSGVIVLNDTVQIPTLDSAGATALCRNASNNLATCSSNPNSVTLQQAYNSSSSPADITTADNKNLSITLADTATDSKFTVNIQGTGNTFEVQDAGTAYATFADARNITFAEGNAGQFAVTSDLSGGERSTNLVTISQANNASNDLSTNLVKIDNQDTGSSLAVVNINQAAAGFGLVLSGAAGATPLSVQAGGTGAGISIDNSLTSGNGLNIVSGGLTTGNGISLNHGYNGAVPNFSGDLIQASGTRTLTTASTVTASGHYLDLNRAVVVNNASATYTTSGDLANLQSNCTQTAGTCTDTAHILTLNQQYANASGTVLNVLGAGTGNQAVFDASNSSANGVSIDVQSSSASQYALQVTSNNGATPDLYVRADGNVGIGDSSPTALLTVGNGDLFQVNSSGDLVTANATLNLFTGTATTANFAQAATNINVGSSSGFNWTPGGNVTIPLGNSKGLTVTSDLSGGARSTDVVTISQANNATNSSTGSLLNLTNSDTTSQAPVLSITQVPTGSAISITGPTGSGGIGIDMSGLGSGSGTGIKHNVSGLTSGTGITLSGTATGPLTPFTGNAFTVTPTRTLSSGSITDTGNFINLTRSNTVNNAGSTYTISGDLANFSSNCTQTAGTCTDTSNILELNQQYANASGTVLNVTGAGTGNQAVFDATNSSANGVSIDVQSSSSSQYALQVTSNNGATNVLYARADGKVGIGTTSPSTSLEVKGTAGGICIRDTTSCPTVSTEASIYIEDRLDLGVQTKTLTDDGTANDSLTPTAAYVRVDVDETANAGVPDLTLSESSARDGDILIITNNELDGSHDTFTITDSAGVVNVPGGSVTLGPEDTITLIYMNDRWVTLAFSDN